MEQLSKRSEHFRRTRIHRRTLFGYFRRGAWYSDEVSERKRTNVMNQTINELDCTDEENLTSELADEHLEAAADPTKPVLWTYPTTSCGGADCSW